MRDKFVTGGEANTCNVLTASERRFRFAVVVPILNAEREAEEFLAGLRRQAMQPDIFLVVDSSSTDRSTQIFADAGAKVHVIPRSEFNHADTRQMAADMCGDVDVVVFLTQDAILTGFNSLGELLSSFDDPDVGTAYGRQLPRSGADVLEAFVRLFNYPDRSEIRSFEDHKRYGFRTCFSSNSYAAYRTRALKEVGGFPRGLISGEDLGVSAIMLLQGWKMAYVAEACVLHSHRYSALAYFRRSFDIGVQHRQMYQQINEFGGPEGMGIRYVLSEAGYLAKNAPLRIPEAFARNFLRYIGYCLGRLYFFLPLPLVRRVSMNRGFWKHSGRIGV